MVPSVCLLAAQSRISGPLIGFMPQPRTKRGISRRLRQSGYWRADKSLRQELLSQQLHINGLIFRVVLIGGDSSNQQAPLMRGEIGNRKSMGHDALRCDRDDW